MTKDTNTIDIFKAVWSDDIEAVKNYINNGGDVNAKDKREGLTVLMWARFGRSYKTVQLLKSHGAVA